MRPLLLVFGCFLLAAVAAEEPTVLVSLDLDFGDGEDGVDEKPQPKAKKGSIKDAREGTEFREGEGDKKLEDLSDDELVVFCKNDAGKTLSTQVIEDPRRMRTEVGLEDAKAGAKKTIKEMFLKKIQLDFDFPKGASKVEIYQPEFKADDSYTLKKIHEMKIDQSVLEAHLARRQADGPAGTVKTLIEAGSNEAKIDMILLGDGYTSDEMGLFSKNVQDMVDYFFTQEPFKEYRSYFNVYQLDTPSKVSGSSHPPAATKDTALGTYYNCGGIKRAICGDETKIREILKNTKLQSGMPLIKADIFYALVNDKETGGTGGWCAFSDTYADDAKETFLHEVGHSFAKLADEYTDGTCDTSRHSRANTSPATEPSKVKWAHWVGEEFEGGKIGMFEGANYCTKGLFRPSDKSKMNVLFHKFDPISIEEIVKRIYRTVSHFVKVNPNTATNVDCSSGSCSQIFQVKMQEPATHKLKLSWSVDGNAVEGSDQLTLDLTKFAPGSEHRVVVKSKDDSPWVRKDPHQRMTEEKIWTLKVGNDKSVSVTKDLPANLNCDDKRNDCGLQKEKGYCSSNAAYMNAWCAQTCATCDIGAHIGKEVATCSDKEKTDCIYWEAQGECSTSPGYMNENCALTCGKCPAASQTTEGSCPNKETDENCKFWAGSGECQKNVNSMKYWCPKSCNMCPTTSKQ